MEISVETSQKLKAELPWASDITLWQLSGKEVKLQNLQGKQMKQENMALNEATHAQKDDRHMVPLTCDF